MAKRLILGNYTFNPEDRVISLKDNVLQERLLLVTNVTDNEIIYNFADPELGATSVVYNSFNDETEITLIYDTTGMSSSDKLQIFIDEQDVSMTPSEDLIDPVGKLRVSNPENLIDTDFEYGLQNTKWETIQTVNNIPTIYSNTGNTSIDGIVSVTTTNTSNSVQVITNIDHNLEIGNPITVNGVNTYQAEGSFIVTSVPSSTEFYFDMDVAATVSEDISGSYTTIVPAKFFEGSSVLVETGNGAVTDEAEPSTVTVTTQQTHGFSEDTKIYLRNTIGPKTLSLDDDDPTVNLAPDGRPFIDTVDLFSISKNVDITTNTGRSEELSYPVISYNTNSTYQKFIESSEVDTVNNTITWGNHNLRNNYNLLFSTPRRLDTDGGLEDGRVYWVEVIDADTIKLHTSEGTNLAAPTTPVSLSALTNFFGLAKLSLVYRVEAARGNERWTAINKRNAGTTSAQTGIASFTTAGRIYTSNINLGTFFGTNDISGLQLDRLYLAGDLNADLSETVRYRFRNNTGTVTSGYGYYKTGFQDSNLRLAYRYSGTELLQVDLDQYIWYSGSTPYITIERYAYTGVNDLGWGFIFRDQMYFTKNAVTLSNLTESQKAVSGGDLIDSQWGLGSSQPTRIVAFQNANPATLSWTSLDGFSYLTFNRNSGRHLQSRINNVAYQATNPSNGIFDINYNQSFRTYTNYEFFYMFCDENTANRDTIYIADHGITESKTASLTIDSTAYANGDRIQFAVSTDGIPVTNNNQTTQVTITPLNDDLIRLTSIASPSTDVITNFPRDFTLDYTENNELYNTIYINSHKITTTVEAEYNLVGASAIPPLVDGTSYFLTRFNDSRINVNNQSGGAVSSASMVYGTATNGSTGQIFFDLTTALGFSPTSADLTQIEFRGDFGQNNEYVDIVFDDGDTYRLGQFDDNGDTSIWTVSTTFKSTGKNINKLLTTSGGSNIGVNIEFIPSSAVNAAVIGGGNTNWWEVRLSVSGSQSVLVLTSGGVGKQEFIIDSLSGAYDGVYPITNTPTQNTFEFESEFQIPRRRLNIVSADPLTDIITLSGTHNYITGEKITYDSNSDSVEYFDTTSFDDIYAIVISPTTIKIASSVISALNNSQIDILSITPNVTHSMYTTNLIKSVQGSGTINYDAATLKVVGTGTKFLNTFRRYDNIYFEDSGSFTKRFTVNEITSDTTLSVFESDSDLSNVNYFFETQISLRPDGYSLHLPFDGGVDITAGTSPYSKISRQTRKYFRYQSGKGIQTSFAINFNPPKIVKDLITASSNVATIRSQEQHNLTVGDEITIGGAEVTSGFNYFNGDFTVSNVIDDFEFQYELAGSPVDAKALGFPTYVRKGWSDSCVRAGMFDDQNGFFYEYDGTNLYAVRRSSTTQLAGTVDVTRNSQIINGTNTSFSTQLNVGDRVVLRGQTYQVVEVSSDIRMVVQPSYRGTTAKTVKLTKTVDTKTPQSSWSLDRADGNGFTGFNLDLTKIQMGYIDYSWYGAGKIRYGFKDNRGHIRYFHEYIHNNRLNESYFRTGNLPARYEIENKANPTTAPTLFHFGTSVIMDGTFNDDKAYQFTGESRPFSFTDGKSDSFSILNPSSFEQVTIDGVRVYVYSLDVAGGSNVPASGMTVGDTITIEDGTTFENLVPAGTTYISKIDADNNKIWLNYPGISSDPTGNPLYPAIPTTNTVFTVGEPIPIELTEFLPLISIRLAPSVDNGLTGYLGQREIINRMQLRLRQASVTSNTDIEVFLIQNALPTNLGFNRAQSPSLSQYIKHSPGDLLIGGTTIYSTKSSAGSVSFDISELLEMGNSILGGDGIFPAGPDLLTLAVQPQSSSGINLASPFTVTGKISWSESQA